MLKYAAVALSGLLAVTLFTADGVIIEDDTPTYLEAGETQAVTITVNKGSVEGFAKLELRLPDGLSAEAISTQEASFTFEGQKAKFIWMALPDADEFTVSYNLTASAEATGELTIQGVFAYIKDNQRVDYELQDKLIRIGTDPGDSADSTTEGDDTTTDTSSDDNTTSGSTESTTSDSSSDQVTGTMPELQAYEGSDLQCLRYMIQTSESEYRVVLKVVNNDLEGFAKITENVPSGMSVAEDDSDAAVVTLEDDGVKYVWFDVPSASSFQVSYLLQQVTGADAPIVDGAFSFVRGNAPYEQSVMDMGATMNPAFQDVADSESDEVDTTTDSIEDTASDVADTVEDTASDVTESVENATDPVDTTADEVLDTVEDAEDKVADATDTVEGTGSNVANNVVEEVVETIDDPVTNATEGAVEDISNVVEETTDNTASQVVDSSTEDTTSDVADTTQEEAQDVIDDSSSATSFPDPEVGISYKVQIAAAHRTVGKSYFNSRHSFGESFNIENHEGWVKYTTGKHVEYKQARDSRNRIKGDYPTLPGPFVTAYNEGVRITVQEALMIANQQWYE